AEGADRRNRGDRPRARQRLRPQRHHPDRRRRPAPRPQPPPGDDRDRLRRRRARHDRPGNAGGLYDQGQAAEAVAGRGGEEGLNGNDLREFTGAALGWALITSLLFLGSFFLSWLRRRGGGTARDVQVPDDPTQPYTIYAPESDLALSPADIPAALAPATPAPSTACRERAASVGAAAEAPLATSRFPTIRPSPTPSTRPSSTWS